MEIPQEKINLLLVDTFNQYLAKQNACELASKYKSPATQRKYKKLMYMYDKQYTTRLECLRMLGLFEKYLDFAYLKPQGGK